MIFRSGPRAGGDTSHAELEADLRVEVRFARDPRDGPPRINHRARLVHWVATHTRRLGEKVMPKLEARVAYPCLSRAE
jgi:hypothetical protein